MSGGNQAGTVQHPNKMAESRQGLLEADWNLGCRDKDLTYQSQSCRIVAVGVLGGSYIPPQLPPCLH